MRWLIVNADDLGLTASVNSGIARAHRQGIVTSASLMANLPETARTVTLIRRNPALGVGLHLNLTAGYSLTDCPALTWTDGSFLPLLRVLLRVAISRRAREQAWAEMEAQADEAQRLRVPIDHLDSHHHIHLFRPLRRQAISLARELNVPMRLPAEQLSAGEWLHDRGSGLASFLASRLRRRRDMPRSADHTLGLRLHRAGFDGPSLVKVLTAIPRGVTEFICHPGRTDAALKHLSSYTVGRERELAALTHPGLRAALDEAGIRLITWKQLPDVTTGFPRTRDDGLG